MIAGVGKTFRMLQDAHEMLRCGTDVQIGYVETHGRADTVRALKGLPVISRKRVFYKGKEMEEMDLDAILQVHPEIVLVDELAHSNVKEQRHAKRWQDVMELLDAGINVLSVEIPGIQQFFNVEGLKVQDWVLIVIGSSLVLWVRELWQLVTKNAVCSKAEVKQ